MRMRDYLKQRRNEMALLVLPGIIFCVLSAIFAHDSVWLIGFSLATLLAGMGAIIVLMPRTPCPQCELPLGSVAARAANGWAKDPRCPHCKVSLDEPMQSPVKTRA